MLKPGEKVHVISRRLFEGDLRRHFVGQVESVEGGAFRAKGHAFVLEPRTNRYEKRPEERVRIFSLNDAALIITVFPDDVDLGKVEYRVLPPSNRLVVTDGKFSLDINEFGSTR